MTRNEIYVDFIAGWASGAISTFGSQPIDTILTRMQATRKPLNLIRGSTVNTTKNLIGSHGVPSLWRGSSAMIGAIPLQNALLMMGYGYGKRWCEEHRPDDLLLGVFIGGCTGGVAQSFLMSPVELIKINQQVMGKTFASATSYVAFGERNIVMKGLGATLLRDGLPHGVWFASYEYMKARLEDNASENSSFIPLFSGAFAALMAWGVGYPFDIIKTRVQASADSTRGALTVINATKEIIQESNGRPFLAFYRGFGLKIAKAVPSSAVNFYVYEAVTKELR